VSARFQSEQWLAAPLERVFAFFADPHNLPRITSPGLGTRLVKLNLVPPPLGPATGRGIEPMAGAGTEMMMAFRVIPYIPIHDRWIVHIVDFSLNRSFRHVQKQGPFRRWEHAHWFEAQTNAGREGTLVRDDVEYEVGFGVIGTTLERLLFQRVMRSTFAYRKKALEKIFGSSSP
jgi:ligand-binding SRPBCC domain-containing protein